MYSQTIAVLEKFDNQHNFERMCADLLMAQGNKDVVLIAPRGGPDGGRDITFTTYDGSQGLACATIGKDDIDRKFKIDFSQRKRGEYQKYVFFCTTYLTPSQKKSYIAYGLNELDAELVPCDIEAMRSLLDAYPSIKERWLRIIDDREWQRRHLVYLSLLQEYNNSFDGKDPAIMAGSKSLPKEWAEKRLEEKGETWKLSQYTLGHYTENS